jgi:hypothetical protein
MGTRRRVRHHRKRYRGGEEFIERPFVMPQGVNPRLIGTLKAKHVASEKARYEAWKAKRDVEAREDAKGREEDAKMAAFNEKQKQQRAKELDDLRKLEEGRRKSVSTKCEDILETNGITGTPAEKRTAYRKFALRNHPDKGGDAEVFKKVDGCYKAAIGAGRKTRRRKSHRRR